MCKLYGLNTSWKKYPLLLSLLFLGPIVMAQNNVKPPEEKEYPFHFEIREEGTYFLKVSTLDQVIVYTETLLLKSGKNTWIYSGKFSKEGRKAYLKKYKKRLLADAEGHFHLPKGSYQLLIEGPNGSQIFPFEISP